MLGRAPLALVLARLGRFCLILASLLCLLSLSGLRAEERVVWGSLKSKNDQTSGICMYESMEVEQCQQHTITGFELDDKPPFDYDYTVLLYEKVSYTKCK